MKTICSNSCWCGRGTYPGLTQLNTAIEFVPPKPQRSMNPLPTISRGRSLQLTGSLVATILLEIGNFVNFRINAPSTRRRRLSSVIIDPDALLHTDPKMNDLSMTDETTCR